MNRSEYRKKIIFTGAAVIGAALLLMPQTVSAYSTMPADFIEETEEELTSIDPEQGEPLTEEEVGFILDRIKEEYPDISENSLAKVELALDCVGNIGYSQSHHSCSLDSACHLSDCSGFVSHIWETELGGIYTTGTFYSKFSEFFFTFDKTAMPGDILLYYEGAADGWGDHALLYVGYLDLGNGDGYQHYTIDCTTINGKGNVYFCSYGEAYVGHCKVLPMDLFKVL